MNKVIFIWTPLLIDYMKYKSTITELENGLPQVPHTVNHPKRTLVWLSNAKYNN